MNKHVNEFKENNHRPVAGSLGKQSNNKHGVYLQDNRSKGVMQRQQDNAATDANLSPVGGPPIQMATKVDYTGQKVKYEVAKPPVKGKKKAKAADQKEAVVGRRMKARLDPDDPIKGSLPGIGGDDAELYDKLNEEYAATYYKGHLLNHNLGGLGVKENLFPLTASANHAHLEQVETPVKSLLLHGNTVDYQVDTTQDHHGADFLKHPQSQLTYNVGVNGQSLLAGVFDVAPDVEHMSLNEELEGKDFGSAGSGVAVSRNKFVDLGLKNGYLRKDDDKIIATTNQDKAWH